jgi:hypothetical protein
MTNHLSLDKRTEKLMAEQAFGNKTLSFQGHDFWNRLAVVAVSRKSAMAAS